MLPCMKRAKRDKCTNRRRSALSPVSYQEFWVASEHSQSAPCQFPPWTRRGWTCRSHRMLLVLTYRDFYLLLSWDVSKSWVFENPESPTVGKWQEHVLHSDAMELSVTATETRQVRRPYSGVMTNAQGAGSWSKEPRQTFLFRGCSGIVLQLQIICWEGPAFSIGSRSIRGTETSRLGGMRLTTQPLWAPASSSKETEVIVIINKSLYAIKCDKSKQQGNAIFFSLRWLKYF